MNGKTLTKLLAFGTTLALLMTFATPVVAQEDQFYYRRAIGEQYTSETATISSIAATPEGSDWILFMLDTKGDEEKGLGLGVIYGHGNAAGDMDHATATFIAPFSIIEFRDVDGDGEYDLKADDVVSLYPLHADMDEHDGFYDQTGESDDTMTWFERPGYKSVQHERTGAIDTSKITLTAETIGGVFAIKMHVTNSVILSEEVKLSPYEVKMDFIINDYPYVANDTIVAFCAIVASANANWNETLPDVYDDWRSNVAEDGMYFDLGDLSEGVGYFSWLKNATLDGEDTPVTTTTLAQFSAFEWTAEKATRIDLKYVAFTYGRAESIIHDPKLGFAFDGIPVALQKLIRGNGGVLLVSLFLFVGMIATVRYARKRGSMPKRVNGVPPTPTAHPPMGQVPPGTLPQMPPSGPPAAPPQGGTPPASPPVPPTGGTSPGNPQAPQYGYRPPGQ